MNNFKNIISARRKELKMTQRELAEKLNVSDKTISKWETGISYPEITLLPAIASVLNLNINDFFAADDFKAKDNELQGKESYHYHLINKYQNKIFITIGLTIAGFFLMFVGTNIENDKAMIILLSLGFVLWGFSLIFFISNNITFGNLYQQKNYTYRYDYIYAKYSSITITLLALPFLGSILFIQSINPFTPGGIYNITSLLIVIISYLALIKNLSLANYKIKKRLPVHNIINPRNYYFHINRY